MGVEAQRVFRQNGRRGTVSVQAVLRHSECSGRVDIEAQSVQIGHRGTVRVQAVLRHNECPGRVNVDYWRKTAGHPHVPIHLSSLIPESVWVQQSFTRYIRQHTCLNGHHNGITELIQMPEIISASPTAYECLAQKNNSMKKQSVIDKLQQHHWVHSSCWNMHGLHQGFHVQKVKQTEFWKPLKDTKDKSALTWFLS
eukprot:1156257-Pelagomonas_calceolata.AAC.3